MDFVAWTYSVQSLAFLGALAFRGAFLVVLGFMGLAVGAEGGLGAFMGLAVGAGGGFEADGGAGEGAPVVRRAICIVRAILGRKERTKRERNEGVKVYRCSRLNFQFRLQGPHDSSCIKK